MMMFPWNIAKSAEDILSRFALKRLCKFLLKKKLGQFIVGDIDLEQLDVQLADGILQLSDLAVNVDFINQKLGQDSVFRVREGSIHSLLIKMPWNGGGCEMEVNDLELVISTIYNENSHKVDGGDDPPEDLCFDNVLGKDEQNLPNKSTASVDVHEGVKVVAKMVKWLLESFHIRIKNVIVAFGACIEKETEEEASQENLVLRVAEIECGTCISENPVSSNTDDFLGINHFTNFLKFEGAIVELLQMNGCYASGCCPRNASKPLLTGEGNGFCGSLKLSIPWRNGSLDIRKVDAEVKVNPLTAKLQPSTLKWILATWDMLQNCKNKKVNDLCNLPTDTVLSGLASPSYSSDGKLRQEKETLLDFSVPLSEAMETDVFAESCLISDWVTFSDQRQNEGIKDADLGASVDQFFECFDGIRSSQSVLGSSGMWGWTSSVFSAVTAASNLASGSLNISTEQQHVQTNLKVSFVKISMILSFLDEDQLTQHGQSNEQVDTDWNIHHLLLRWEDISMAVQVNPQDWKLETTLKHMHLDDYLSGKEDSVDFCFPDLEKDASTQTLMIRSLQDKIKSTLPSSSLFAEASNADMPDKTAVVKDPSSLISSENCEGRNNIVKATVFQTYGASCCRFAVTSKSSSRRFAAETSISLELPAFIFWLNFDLVTLVLNFLKELENSLGEIGKGADSSLEAFENNRDTFAPSNDSWNLNHHTVSPSGKGSMRGNIFLPHARIILGFPIKNVGGFRSYTSMDQFIALDFSSPPDFKKLKAEVPKSVREETVWKKDYASSHSVHLNVVFLDVYHITNDAGDFCGSSAELSGLSYFANKIMTIGNGSDWVYLVSLLWHIDAVTGAWIVNSAKLISTLDDPLSKDSSPTSGYQFTSASSNKDTEDIRFHKQKELVLSSKFCLHVCLPAIVVTVCRSQYLRLFCLLNEAMDVFSVDSNKVCDNKKITVSQTSFLLECGHIEVNIELEHKDCPQSLFQKELPGSWQKFRLEIQNLRLLSVSDIGAVSGASFFWISHCEGKLWGSVTKVADQDFLLISCSNGASGRGDGEGSNLLSCRPAGSDIVLMWDPKSSHNFVSIAVKCGTIVAPGGRLDWLDKLSSFFCLPLPEAGKAADSQKGDSQSSSFVLKFTDAALSYEPYSWKSECLNSKPGCSISFNKKTCDPYVACLLASSSLLISNTNVAGAFHSDYRIRFQDSGLLLHAVSEHENVLIEYSANKLRELGYVKIAEEALVNAMLRINCESDFSWELTCSECHIVMSTCHDTTFGLIRLVSQIQQLCAPDMEESIVHLQNRWNSLQQMQGRDGPSGELETSGDCSLGTLQEQQSNSDSKGTSGLVGLMDEICEDAFLLCGQGVSSFDGSQVTSVDENLGNVESSSTVAHDEIFLEGNHTSCVQKAELIEGYYLSDLRSLSELTINSHFSDNFTNSRALSRENREFQRGNCGWYGRSPLSIVEDYVSDNTDCSSSKQVPNGQQNEEQNCSKRYKGCALLKNIEVKWRMYAGSDWNCMGKSAQHSGRINGRDSSAYLELVLSNMNIEHSIFPDGDICVSELCVSVQDFFLYDKSNDAPWTLVLGYYHSRERPRESSSQAIKFHLETVRPDPTIPLEECRLRVAFLPILLHLHQSQLDFLAAFFGCKDPLSDQSQNTSHESGLSSEISKDNSKCIGIAEEALLPFFQKFDIWPIIIRVDYRPSRVDLAALSGGKYVELVNLVPWKGIELQLKHVQAAGVYGWSNVCEIMIGEWLEDISRNQIRKLLRGLPPIQSFVSVGSGAAKFVSLPLKNYKKDHRLVKGLQRGTVAFLRSISVEALGLGVHLAAGADNILFHAECILTHIQPSVPQPLRSKPKKRLKSNQPEDAQRGIKQAYDRLSDGLGKSASAMLHTPIKTYQRSGSVGSALVTAVRGAPAAAIAPASAAAQAFHCALVGVRNSLDPEHKTESMNKYLGPSHYRERG